MLQNVGFWTHFKIVFRSYKQFETGSSTVSRERGERGKRKRGKQFQGSSCETEITLKKF